MAVAQERGSSGNFLDNLFNRGEQQRVQLGMLLLDPARDTSVIRLPMVIANQDD